MSSDEGRFVSEEIDMVDSAPGGAPVRFIWRAEEHRVSRIIKSWQDWGHSASAHKKSWKNRRHRNYYEIETDRELHALVYFDRGVKPSSPRNWIILEVYE